MDTRSNEQLGTPMSVGQLGSGGVVTQVDDNVPTPTGLQDLTLTDFEQLIYANSLAKRPMEAEQAFNLMEVIYFSLFLYIFGTNTTLEIQCHTQHSVCQSFNGCVCKLQQSRTNYRYIQKIRSIKLKT